MIDFSGGVVFDPHSIFKIDRNSVFLSDIRHHGASAIRVSDADCIIIGTSMIANTSPKYIKENHGKNCINVSMLGASLYERIMVLEYALNMDKYDTVILSLDYFGKYGESNPAIDLESYNFFYDDSVFNDTQFYLGFQWVFPLIKKISINISEDMSLNVWDKLFNAVRWDSPQEMSRFGGLSNWIISAADNESKRAIKSIIDKLSDCEDIAAKNLTMESEVIHNQQRLIGSLSQLMGSHSNTNFFGVIPPYSSLKRALDSKCEPYLHNKFIAEIRALVKLSHEYSNFIVHGFDDKNFVKNLENYKDTRHYSPLINKKIIDSIMRGVDIVNETNIKEYELEIRANIDDFKIERVKSELIRVYSAYE